MWYSQRRGNLGPDTFHRALARRWIWGTTFNRPGVVRKLNKCVLVQNSSACILIVAGPEFAKELKAVEEGQEKEVYDGLCQWEIRQ